MNRRLAEGSVVKSVKKKDERHKKEQKVNSPGRSSHSGTTLYMS
jgi:hypothetical protein